MPVHKVVNTPERLQIWVDSRGPSSDTDVITEIAKHPNPVIAAAAIKVRMQNGLDTRQKRNKLSKDDPDRAADPNRPDLFWDGGDLVGRSVVVDVTWDGVRFNLSVSKVAR